MATSSLHLTDGVPAMPQPNDLSRSLVALDQEASPLNHYLRPEVGLGGCVRELAIRITVCELDTSPALELDPRTVVS